MIKMYLANWTLLKKKSQGRSKKGKRIPLYNFFVCPKAQFHAFDELKCCITEEILQ